MAGRLPRPQNLVRAFDAAATRYYLMVALNPGYHQHLRSAARTLAEHLPAAGSESRIVDLGCGSGASTCTLLKQLRFDSVPAFCDRLFAAGCTDVQVRTVPGQDILHTFRARKPADAVAVR